MFQNFFRIQTPCKHIPKKEEMCYAVQLFIPNSPNRKVTFPVLGRNEWGIGGGQVCSANGYLSIWEEVQEENILASNAGLWTGTSPPTVTCLQWHNCRTFCSEWVESFSAFWQSNFMTIGSNNKIFGSYFMWLQCFFFFLAIRFIVILNKSTEHLKMTLLLQITQCSFMIWFPKLCSKEYKYFMMCWKMFWGEGVCLLVK